MSCLLGRAGARGTLALVVAPPSACRPKCGSGRRPARRIPRSILHKNLRIHAVPFSPCVGSAPSRCWGRDTATARAPPPPPPPPPPPTTTRRRARGAAFFERGPASNSSARARPRDIPVRVTTSATRLAPFARGLPRARTDPFARASGWRFSSHVRSPSPPLPPPKVSEGDRETAGEEKDKTSPPVAHKPSFSPPTHTKGSRHSLAPRTCNTIS
jgi:hypothetical protein